MAADILARSALEGTIDSSGTASVMEDGRGRPWFDWVTVPAGVALIGAEASQLEAARPNSPPAGTPEVTAFVISRTPVTNAQYALFVAATGHRPPAHWEGVRPPTSLRRHPVTYVDWRDTSAYCAWAGVRLPTEAEWEKAARGIDGRPFPWGTDDPSPLQANCQGWFGTTTKVGLLTAGASPYGVLDMAGNVWEWTASLDRPYPYAADDGREVPSDVGRRVLRGGSFQHPATEVGCAVRSSLYGDACDEYIGFRVAADHAVVRDDHAFDWVAVPGGPFRMGTWTANEAGVAFTAGWSRPGLGTPVHQVDLAAYAISRTPVTNGQYATWVAAAGVRPPDHWEGGMPPNALADHPVTHIDWHEARAFCDWAGVRLPTEAEWEKAARGLDSRLFPWGFTDPDESTAWFGHPADDVGTRDVRERPAGASPYGVLDMVGNTWEWTSSLHRPYPYGDADGREDPAIAGQRVLRGGSFRSPGELYLRCAFRSRSFPSRRRDHIGFRVALSPVPGAR